jgi:hypothetical protein
MPKRFPAKPHLPAGFRKAVGDRPPHRFRRSASSAKNCRKRSSITALR